MSLDVTSSVPAAPAAPPRRVRERLRDGGATTPGRLHRVGATLVAGCLLTALLSLLGGQARAEAVQDGRTRVAELSTDAAALYQSLADAEATATSGYLAGSREPAAVRSRYDADVARAADRLVHAANRLADGDPAARPVARIAAALPVYTGLVEAARAINRQGLPLGQSYLGSGSRLVRSEILPAADELRRLQSAALAERYERGTAVPVAALLIGLGTLAGLVDLAVRERRRTNRFVEVGLLAAGVALMAGLLWWVAALTVADARLDEARRHGDAAAVLDEARATILQARSSENLLLIARGGGFTSDADVTERIDQVLGTGSDGGLLARALPAAPAQTIDTARAALVAWREAHRFVEERDDGGDYAGAVASATGTEPDSSGATFERADAVLADATAAERASFASAADGAATALTGLAAGPALLALVAAGAVVVGVGRRAGEYR